MDFRDTAEEAAFRKELRYWLTTNAPHGYTDIKDDVERHKMAQLFHRMLHEAGYMGLVWPQEYGGRGLIPTFDAILNEEVGASDSPPLPAMANYLGRILYTYGTEEQRQRFLPSLLDGALSWCQAYSEPEAGSDISSLRTRAELRDDVYVVNGHKMWTSGALYADWCILLARTDPSAPKHKGISCFLVSMKSFGIDVHEIVMADGAPQAAEIFWNDVEIPVDQMLGQPGQGWEVAMATFAYERGPGDVGVIAAYNKALRVIEAEATQRGTINDATVREALGQAYVRGEVLRLVVLEQLSQRVSGMLPGPESSIAKVLWADADQYLHRTAMDLVGADAVTGRKEHYLRNYLRSRAASVYGGTTQIQKNILAQRALGMPR